MAHRKNKLILENDSDTGEEYGASNFEVPKQNKYRNLFQKSSTSKITILENKIIRSANKHKRFFSDDSESDEEIFSKQKKYESPSSRNDIYVSPSGTKLHVMKSVSIHTKTQLNEKKGEKTVKNILKENNINYSPRSSSPDRWSMYSSRGCSPSLNNLSYSKLMHGIELNVDESQYHELIHLSKNKQEATESTDLKHKQKKIQGMEMKNPNDGKHLTSTYSFEDDLSQNSTKSKEISEQKKEEIDKEEETERGKETEKVEEIQKEKETERVEEPEREEDTERLEEIEREEETERVEESESKQETERGEETEKEEETDEDDEQEVDEEEEEYDFESNDSDEYCPSEVVSELSAELAINNDDEDDAQKNDEEVEWVDITDFTLDLEECTLNESTINISIENTTPDGIFSLFLTDEIIEKMVTETNKYASAYNTEKHNKNEMKRKSRLLAWKPTNATEMRKFLGVVLVMGLNKVPHLNEYWSKKSLYRNEYIVSVMRRDRFLLILKFWHFSDDSANTNNTSKLRKIENLTTMMNKRFQEVLTPGKYLVIDED